MTLLLDATGGIAPQAAQAAAAASLDKASPDLILLGEEATLTAALSKLAHDPARLMVVHVAAHTRPEDSAPRLMALLRDHRASALVSASPPGALTRAASEVLPALSPHPALCAVYPTARARGPSRDPYVLLLDVGASFGASAEALVTYAKMGAAYAGVISRNARPKVALLGSQIGGLQGPPEACEAAKVLGRQQEGFEFVGLLDALAVPLGSADVFVCDGHTGQTVLRLLEGVGAVAGQLVESSKRHGLKWRLALDLISDGIGQVGSIARWESYGGAPLLGYAAPILLAHPEADAEGLKRSLKLAAKAVRSDVGGVIRDRLQPRGL